VDIGKVQLRINDLKAGIACHFLFILLFSFSSCGQKSARIEKALKTAGENRKELEKVIHHYKQTGESEKLKAAYFLNRKFA